MRRSARRTWTARTVGRIWTKMRMATDDDDADDSDDSGDGGIPKKRDKIFKTENESFFSDL
jgi:hypothetical protein